MEHYGLSHTEYFVLFSYTGWHLCNKQHVRIRRDYTNFTLK